MKISNKFIVILTISLLSYSNIGIFGQIMIGETYVDTTTIVSGLKTPWEILWGPDNHIWITEREGKVSRLNPQNWVHTYVLSIPDVHEQVESGLLGMVVHPDFPSTSYVYLVYTYMSGTIKEKIVRYTWNNASLVDPFVLLEGIQGSIFHNGARMVIDSNYKLFVTTGEAGNTSLSQDLSSLSGKVLRMNLDGTIPEDNPIKDSYIWSWGHRNAQGLIIAPDGKIYSSEHGPTSDDELNIIEKGQNYGWPDVNGFCDNESELAFCNAINVKDPLFTWTPTLAVAGIAYYGHDAIPEWKNKILMANLKSRKLESLSLSSDGLAITETSTWFQNWFGRLRDVCVAPDGRVFIAVSNRDGRGTPTSFDDRIVLVKASGLSDSGQYNKNKGKISIAPNPVSSYSVITIPSEQPGPGELTIYDLSGNQVFKDVFSGSEYTINKNNLVPGFYMIRIRKGSLLLNSKIIVL